MNGWACRVGDRFDELEVQRSGQVLEQREPAPPSSRWPRSSCRSWPEGKSRDGEHQPADAPDDRLPTAGLPARRQQTQLEPEAGEDDVSRRVSQSDFHDSAGQDVASVACAPAARTAAERVAMS
jgi:hypothetical protein